MIRSIVFTFLISLHPPTSNAAFADDHLSIERITNHQDGVGHVVLGENETIFFEYVRPLNRAPSYRPFMNRSHAQTGSKLLMRIDGADDAVASPLFEQDPEWAYFFASIDESSPEKRYLSVAKSDGQRLVPGVFDIDRDKVTFFESIDLATVGSVHWLSESEIVVRAKAVNRAREFSFSFHGKGPQAQAAAREDAWRGIVTASVLSAGRSRGNPLEFPKYKLVKIDVLTGTQTELYSAPGLTERALSASRRYMVVDHAATSRFDALPAVSAEIQSSSAQSERIWRLVDVATGVTNNMTSEHGLMSFPIAWAPGEDRLLFTSDTEGKKTIRIFDVPAGTVREIKGIEIAPAAGRKNEVRRWSPRVWQLTWLTDDIVAFPIVSENNQKHWLHVGPDGQQTVFSTGLDIVDTTPIARAGEELVFFASGELIAVDGSGRSRTLTSSLPPVSYDRETIPGSWREGRSRSLPNLADLSFKVSEHDAEQVITFNSLGKISVRVALAGADSIVHKVSPCGVIYSQLYPDQSSRLVYVAVSSDGHVERIRSLMTYNNHLKDAVTTGPAKRVDYRNEDGDDLHGWLFLPTGASWESDAEHPLIVIAYAETIYPPTLSNDVAFFDKPWAVEADSPTSVQLFTAAGYAVLLPSIPLNWSPSDPMVDMMPSIHGAVDAAVATGLIDEVRMALSGVSYGGYTAYSVGVQTTRFQALIAQAGNSNLLSAYGQFNVSRRFEPARQIPTGGAREQWRMGAPPWEDEIRYIRNSPLFHTENMETPILIIQGDLDYVHLQQGEEIFTALAEQGKDVKFIRYWGEGHSVVQPQNQRHMWNSVFDFLKANGVTPGPK